MTAEMGKEDAEAEFCRDIEGRTGIEDRTAAEYEGCLSMQQYSWLDALQDGGITTYAGWENHFDKWSAAMYWSIVTITSVGYGDITPQNPAEMRICTLLLLWGSCLWAYIIGNACGIVSTLDVDTMQHHQRMDQLNFMCERVARLLRRPRFQSLTTVKLFGAQVGRPELPAPAEDKAPRLLSPVQVDAQREHLPRAARSDVAAPPR